MNELNEIDSNEADFILELILAVVFMSIGIFGIILTVRAMTARVELTPRVDKVQVTDSTIRENNPFDFTGYQAYMFAWHMDGLSDTGVMWTAGYDYMDVATTLPSGIVSKQAAVINPSTNRSNFITYRNQIITGTRLGKDHGVANMLSVIAGNDNTKLVNLYRGLNDSGKFILKPTDDHITLETPLYDFSGDFIEERKVYTWTFCHQGTCTH